ncbi:hypothetical protein DSCA_54360 [Desulfosarcina alkanivorans]|uniref:TIGR03790 family protein n=1 Tax=Desulfosarcina alkanivorans TaxID=571177 RepID=A0A5K7YQH5_9BACT|nr:TIGR03790 family protein [Desulfosarcina alkanivorans]BBO71506.1 hypothetical protein DSCA_54360 [Desulfosarcina alkanivorans]
MEQIRYRRQVMFALCFFLLIPMAPRAAQALEPGEVLIIANQQSPKGVALARYYATKRNIPDRNLLLLDLPVAEVCSRDAYDHRIAAPVRAFLKTVEPAWGIRCLVLTYGMPLKVAPADQDGAQTASALKEREAVLERLTGGRHETGGAGSPSALSEELADVRRRLHQQKIATDQWASVDSELAIVRALDAPVGGWVENPFYIGFRKRPASIAREDVLMVSRLDGPTAASVKRIIDDAVLVEKTGLSGTAYFDARWPADPSPATSAYRIYDRSIHQAARQVKGRMPVMVDDADTLFQPGQCPDAALYCGWYSLATYVDAFDWQPGAVGFHIASSECTTLKKENSQVWCKRMIEKGACATIGPVGEPYLQAFPMPEVFFGFLSEGVLSLAECYMVSLPYLSWKMVLIGDPLYRPF